MSNKVRRAAGAALILTACLTAGTGFLIGGGGADPGRSPAARAAADVARRRVDDAWRAQRSALEARVLAAAATQPLQAALNSHVDGATMLDLFENEDWWRPVRDEFKVLRLVAGSQILVTQGEIGLDAVDGELVAAAIKDHTASALVMVTGRPFVAAAAVIAVADAKSPVLLLATPFDAGFVGRLAERAGQAVMASQTDGQAIITGTAEQRQLLQSLTGREAEGMVVGPHGHWVAALATLGPGQQLWTLSPVTLDSLPSKGHGYVPWMVAPVLLAGGILLLISRQRAAAGKVHGPVVQETTLRFGGSAHPPAKVESQVLSVSSPPQPPQDTTSVAGAGTELADRRPAAQGKIFGRYKLLDQLGQGGMADIYTAVATGVEGFTRIFVLKRLRPELAHDKEAVSQFIDEARMQAGLVHSNIVPVFDFGVVNGEYFMTQEYIVGRDMVRVAHRYHEYTKRSMEPRYAYYVAHETLRALEYAHTKCDRDGYPMGIVHRDVSAGNIMISLEGEVKLFDFGIVKARGRSTQTQVGMVKGNTSFMSPEQARGQDVDARSDVFSLGLVMYYCLTGRLLYEGDNDLDVLYKAATGPTEKDWEEIYQLPRPAPDLLARALAIDPNQRFQCAADFAHELGPHINGVKAEAASLMQLLFGDELRREAA